MRHLFTALVMVSAVALVAFIFLWTRSQGTRDTIVRARGGDLVIWQTEPGGLTKTQLRYWPADEPTRWESQTVVATAMPEIVWSDSNREAQVEVDAKGHVRVGAGDPGPFHLAKALPAAVGTVLRFGDGVLVSSVLPLAWIILWFRRSEARRRRARLGLCPACGYDIRAYSDECPGCGRPIA
jgi:hypothetical protein